MPARKPPPWTRPELAILREVYPREGLDGVCDLLADRSWKAIHQKAHKLGLRCEKLTEAPTPALAGDALEDAIRLREEENWSFACIGVRFGVSGAGACNAVTIALCPRKGFKPAERDEYGRLLPEGVARLRYALKKGLKAIDIQLRLGLSASRIAEERRRYNRELKAQGKMPLPPPGGGEAYSGVKLSRATKADVEALLLRGFGAKKIAERTGVSNTSVGRIRARLVRRLKRKGETLPGCDERGVRRAIAESSAYIPDECKQALRAMLLERIPVRRAAKLCAIGTKSAYALRDAFAAELAARGEELPEPALPGRVNGGYPADPTWPPQGHRQIYAFRELMREMSFDDARAEWRRARREELQRERDRPKSFEEQLARIGRGEIGIQTAIPRAHLDTTKLRPEERPGIAA